jgi:hypothetical protein
MPDSFNVSGQFVFDVMPPNSVFLPLHGTLTGGGLEPIAMDGMLIDGGISATPATEKDTFITFKGTATAQDGTYSATGEVMANYKSKSVCTGTFAT